MDAIIHQILLLFLILPVIIQSQNSCPISTCSLKNSDLKIQYPFKLQTDHPPTNCYNSINLRCDDEGQVVINLVSLGEFYVTSIDYVFEKIVLTDPGNCLLGRLMRPYNYSPFPLEANFFRNYTYYTCPKQRVRPPFTEIHCLSNSVNATVATTVSSPFMKDKYGCTPVVSSMIPVSWSSEYNLSGNFGELQLTWNVPRCRECYTHYSPPYSDGSKSKVAKFVQSPIFITIVSILATFSGIAFLLRLTAAIADPATTDDTTANNTAEDAATSTAVAPPPPPPQATAGDENSQVKSFSEVELIGETQGTLLSCSICLEEYNDKDKVRNLVQCGHYFHVECIDQWLHKNSSCPVCRTSLS